MIADYYIQKTGGQGRYAVLYFSQGYVSSMRGDTFIEHIRKHSELKLLSSYYTDGNRHKSKLAAGEILSNNNTVDFIYACSTDVAHGAIDAALKLKRNKTVMINGWGGGSSELQAIRNGIMDVTVMRMNDDNGVAMAEAIRNDIEKKPVPIIYSGEFALIEKGMDPKKLEKLRQHAFRYSGN